MRKQPCDERTPLLPLLRRIQAFPPKKRPLVISIDGRAASGKTSLARLLSAALHAPVIHMDDFFLPPELRTAQRRAEIGGNVHYERFAAEVLPHLKGGSAFSYRRFDCSRMKYGETVDIPAALIYIVEGSYSRHPSFGDYADVSVFSHVDADTQRKRILLRNGAAGLERFETLWIPMEERYFSSLSTEGWLLWDGSRGCFTEQL